jgi:hypothetical protein
MGRRSFTVPEAMSTIVSAPPASSVRTTSACAAGGAVSAPLEHHRPLETNLHAAHAPRARARARAPTRNLPATAAHPHPNEHARVATAAAAARARARAGATRKHIPPAHPHLVAIDRDVTEPDRLGLDAQGGQLRTGARPRVSSPRARAPRGADTTSRQHANGCAARRAPHGISCAEDPRKKTHALQTPRAARTWNRCRTSTGGAAAIWAARVQGAVGWVGWAGLVDPTNNFWWTNTEERGSRDHGVHTRK